MAEITKKELTIVGSRLNNNCFDEVIAGFEDGTLKPEQLMTKAYNYKDIMEALTYDSGTSPGCIKNRIKI